MSNFRGALQTCYFDKGLSLPTFQDFYEILSWLSIVRPTIGKEYGRRPFANLVKKAQRAILDAKEVYLVGYSLPVYDTLAEFLISSINSNCKLTIVNLGEEADTLKERIVEGSNLEWNQVNVSRDGVKGWLQ